MSSANVGPTKDREWRLSSNRLRLGDARDSDCPNVLFAELVSLNNPRKELLLD